MEDARWWAGWGCGGEAKRGEGQVSPGREPCGARLKRRPGRGRDENPSELGAMRAGRSFPTGPPPFRLAHAAPVHTTDLALDSWSSRNRVPRLARRVSDD